MLDAVQAFNMDLFTDSAGSAGFGAYCKGHLCFELWIQKDWVKNLALLKLFLILVDVYLGGSV